MSAPPKIGLLMLDTKFPRYVGDVGNPASFDFPMTIQSIPGATPEAIVQGDPRVWEDAFISAGQQLVRQGCKGLATTCGFLTLVRDRVARDCGVPVASSALEQIEGLLGQGRRPGILTISKASLSRDHLAAVHVPATVPVVGLDGGHFAQQILGNRDTLDPDQSRSELVHAALTLCQSYPQVDCLVLECTNMPPHSGEIAQATGKDVFDIVTHLTQFHRSL